MFNIGQYCINNPYLLAPMAAVSEKPFRIIALEYGAGLATTKLISAKSIFYKNRRTKQYLTFNPKVEKPFSVQLFGGEPAVMATAAVEVVRLGAQIIDINMGCPVKKVTKTGAGSSLMSNPALACQIVTAIKKAVGDKVPVTAKIRSGWNESSKNAVGLGKELENAGLAALAIHGRTRAQAYRGKADWNIITQVKQAISIPVIGNGDIFTPKHAENMFKQTGCDGVMIGRGALGNPWIFKSLSSGSTKQYIPSNEERLQVLLRHFKEHLQLYEQFKPMSEKANACSIRSFRGPLVWYSRGLDGASLFRKKIMQISGVEELRTIATQFLKNEKSPRSIEYSEQ